LEEDDENNLIVDENEQTQGAQEEPDFQYKQSKWLDEMENNMPDSSKAFVADGKVEETLTDTFTSTMATDVAKAGFTDANNQWQSMLEGPEAFRVIGTFGHNFKTIVSSNDAANLIKILATTAHVLLTTAGEAKMSSGLRDIISTTYSLFASPNMPKVIEKSGKLVTSAVNKPGGPLFTKTFWDEIEKLLSVKNLNEKLKKNFANLLSIMNSLSKNTKFADSAPPKRKRL